MKTRRITRCAACSKDFSYLINITEQRLRESEWKIKLACPFCTANLEIDLTPYKQPTVTVYKGLDNDNSILILPEQLPTKHIL